MRFYLIITFMVLFTVPSYAEEPIVSGKYKSLDGKFEHNFMASGDYEGSWTGIDAIGLYKQGEGVCRTQGGNVGNVVLYYDTNQCCLRFQPISDKLAVTMIYSPVIGQGWGVCQNQVLIRVGK